MFVLYQDGDESEVLDHLDSAVGKRALLKMRRNDYNIRFPHSSISVSQFILCEDLMDQFQNADDDDSNGGSGGSDRVLSNKKVTLTSHLNLNHIALYYFKMFNEVESSSSLMFCYCTHAFVEKCSNGFKEE